MSRIGRRKSGIDSPVGDFRAVNVTEVTVTCGQSEYLPLAIHPLAFLLDRLSHLAGGGAVD
jgi:hypothetical protein